MDKLTVVYASDEKYAKLTAISAYSLVKQNPGTRIVLLGCNLDREAQDIVRKRVEWNGCEFVYLDVSGEIDKLVSKGYCGYTSYTTYARIFIPELMPDEKRVVYLDGDTLVNGRIDEMLATPMNGKALAFGIDCVPHSFKKYIKVPENQPYFNSGVMVIDIKSWREKNCTERFLDELEHPKGPVVLGDQDIYPRAFPEEIALLHPKWNFISHFFLFSYNGVKRVVGGPGNILFTEKEYEEAQRDPRIFHFLGNTLGRPWYTSSRHPMRQEYRKIADEAGLADFTRQIRPMGKDYLLQYWMHRILPQSIFDLSCAALYRVNILKNYKV